MLRRLLMLALLISPMLGVAKAAPDSKTKIEIKAIRFIGVKRIPVDELREVLVNKRSSFFGLISLNGKYHPKELKGDVMRLRDVYFQHGYLDVRIARPQVTVTPGTHEAIVTYRIQEGLPYTVSSVHIVPSHGVDVSTLQRRLSLKSGRTFDVAKLREDIRTITTHVGDKGYAFVQVKPQFRKNSRKQTIAIAYQIQPGSKAYIHNIRIHGNTKTKDSVIRGYIALAPGDRYRLSDVIDAQNELSRSGYFDRVTLRPVHVRGNQVDIDINVKESKTGSIMGALGYDSLEGLFVEGSFSEKNLFGSGITTSLSASYSKLKKNGTLSFDDPRVAGTMFGLYGGLYRTDTEDDSSHTYGFDKKELGGYIGLRRKINSELSTSLDYNYDDVRHSNITTTTITLKDYIKSSIGLSLTYNNTDNFYTPRKGIYAKARIEYAGLGSGPTYAKFLKNSLKFAAYYGLRDAIGYDLIFRYKMRATYISDLGFTPEAERLHLGGYYNGVRGYRSASIHPTTGGGLMSMVNSLEASIPLSEKNQVRLTGFYDHGAIGNASLTEVTAQSFGAQIEWRSPMGDVNFILAKTIGTQPTGSSPSSFEFTVGKEF